MSSDCNCHCDTGCYNSFSATANQVWEQIGSPTDYSLAQISGYFLSTANIGKLNNSIDTNYCIRALYVSGANSQITGFEFKPQLCTNEIAVYVAQFYSDYYLTFANQILRSSMAGQGSVLQLKEADNSVSFVNKGVLAAQVRGLAKDANDVLRTEIADYLRFSVGAGAVTYSEDLLNFQPYQYGYGYGWGGGYGYGSWSIIPYGYWGGRGYYA